MSLPVPKFLAIVLLPAILLAQMLCVCGHTTPKTEAAAATHACCTADADASLPTPQPPHVPSCPHCGEGGDVLTIADARHDVSAGLAPAVAWLSPMVEPLAFATPAIGGRLHAEVDPAPPPDILRTTGILLI